ncbi:MAG: ribosome small subunit-dependent GTPase A [Spirochaetales bacterium]|nr:ribosome small subunit-dependent GTPase A [Spirochaetales bacterium]
MNTNENRLCGTVVEHNREHYKIQYEGSVVNAGLSGSFRYRAASASDLPVVGDRVYWAREGEQGVIHEILPRTSMLSRKTAGEVTSEQPLAANIDKVCIVMALDGSRNYSLRSLERYLTIAWNSGAMPLVILNKADLCDDPEIYRLEAETSAPGVEVITCSAQSGDGVEQLRQMIHPGETAVLIGPSGVGKSALTNILLGTEERQTGSIREHDKRGRHTTTTSRLLMLPDGGGLIDSPGLREIQLWGDLSSLEDAFSDVAELAEQCRFRDCRHQGEPGCAVQQGLVDGVLDPSRFQSYLELQRELQYLAEKQRQKDQPYEEGRGKKLAKYIKNFDKTIY